MKTLPSEHGQLRSGINAVMDHRCPESLSDDLSSALT
ncbi:hypothetical protein TREES_T100001753 [Tupaia chinensis]|uniref:Uncharacterized protein n=1 Tax=Tupaia chinensis TaxID=246437 RepID=L9KJS2_TUPCH|nr:hypothetical protein TREES_T100001753 [Tupaia chinensis]